MAEVFCKYQPQAEFIAELLGPDAEVLVYSIPEKKLICAVNPLEGAKTGDPMGSPEQDYLADRLYEKKSFAVDYRALSKSRHKMKSASLFLRSDDGAPEAVLTVNIRVDKYIELREMINIMIRGQHPNSGEEAFYEQATFLEIMQKVILEELSKYTAAPNRLSYQEKIALIEALHKRGVFNVKGAVTELARLLETTETSIYRYLNKMPNYEDT